MCKSPNLHGFCTEMHLKVEIEKKKFYRITIIVLAPKKCFRPVFDIL